MCGRYTLTISLEQLMMYYHLEMQMDPFHTPRYNIAPMQMVHAVIHDGRKNKMGELRWGLVPNWAKDEKLASGMINARSETLLHKPAFRTLVSRKRCIVPADGFYEWKKNGAAKQPMRIVMKDRQIFSMAALYDTWVRPDGSKVSTCTVITTTPNELMAPIHDRMPVILRPEDEQVWLDRGNQDVGLLTSLLQPYASDRMHAYAVPSLVGNVKNETAACIEEVPGLL